MESAQDQLDIKNQIKLLNQNEEEETQDLLREIEKLKKESNTKK